MQAVRHQCKVWRMSQCQVFFCSMSGTHRIKEGVAHDAGAESCDGTGWFRGDQKQLSGLRRYLYESVAGRSQLELDL